MSIRWLLLSALTVALSGTAVAQDLEADLTKQLDGLKARSSLYARHIPSGRTIAIRADQPMNTLSVIKLAVMIKAFRDVEAGKFKLTDRYTVRPEDFRRGSGLIQTFDPGISLSYRDLIEQMIITSDNTATDILIGKVGLAPVNEMLSQLGFTITRLKLTTADLFKEVWIRTDPKNASMSNLEVFQKGFPSGPNSAALTFKLEGDSTRWLGVTTAREISTMVQGILDAKYASADHSKQMIAMMGRQFYASRLPRRVQYKGVQVAHKTGDWPPYAGNDVGVMFYQGGPTVVAIFTSQNTGDFVELEATEGRIAERLAADWK